MKYKYIFLLILILLGFAGYNYLYQEHRNIETEKPEFRLTSIELLREFSNNLVQSEKKYLNNTIELIGNITNQSDGSVTLDYSVFCQFENIFNFVIENDAQIKVKGRLIGYDDLLEQVKLDQCSIIPNN